MLRLSGAANEPQQDKEKQLLNGSVPGLAGSRGYGYARNHEAA